MFIYQWNCIIYVLILYFNLLWKNTEINKIKNQIKSNNICIHIYTINAVSFYYLWYGAAIYMYSGVDRSSKWSGATKPEGAKRPSGGRVWVSPLPR